MSKKETAIKNSTLSFTVPNEIVSQLNLIAELEERSKSFYMKKALQEFIAPRLKKELVEKIGEEGYKKYLEMVQGVSSLEELKKKLKLD